MCEVGFIYFYLGFEVSKRGGVKWMCAWQEVRYAWADHSGGAVCGGCAMATRRARQGCNEVRRRKW
jgi:hypothetical protein